MDFIEKNQELSQRIPKQIDHIQTEEAAKSALIMPFIQALGYDVFNPMEVVPEFVADVGTKKIQRANLADGSNIEDLVTLDATATPHGIAVHTPEPASGMVLALGFVTLVGYARRLRKGRQARTQETN